jgi:hypothetical protein
MPMTRPPPPGQANEQARAVAERPGRPVQRPGAAQSDIVAEPAGETGSDDLPVVPDRLRIPKAERAAYDDGLAAGMNGWDEKVPRRFQPGQRMVHLLPYRRAGYRDGAAKRQARIALQETMSEAKEPSATV